MPHKPIITAFDLEGCLVPEIWIGLAEKTGIEELRLTTRDISDYNVLMKKRLGILEEHGLTIRDLQEVIGGLSPLPGAPEFLDWLRDQAQLVILSDTFYEFAAPLMVQLNRPTLFCHTLLIDGPSGKIQDYRLRVDNGKKGAVRGFQENGFFVIAVGDSYNDTDMLGQADRGILFHAPDNVIKDFPHFPSCDGYAELKAKLQEYFKSA